MFKLTVLFLGGMFLVAQPVYAAEDGVPGRLPENYVMPPMEMVYPAGDEYGDSILGREVAPPPHRTPAPAVKSVETPVKVEPSEETELPIFSDAPGDPFHFPSGDVPPPEREMMEAEVPLLPREMTPPRTDTAVTPAVVEMPNSGSDVKKTSRAPEKKAEKTAPASAAIPSAEKTPSRPWGLLAFTFFMLLLSLSGNVFLAWQYWEQRKLLAETLTK